MYVDTAGCFFQCSGVMDWQLTDHHFYCSSGSTFSALGVKVNLIFRHLNNPVAVNDELGNNELPGS